MEGRTHGAVVMKLMTLGDAAWEAQWRNQALPAGVGQAAAFRIAPGYDLEGATHVAVYETTQADAAALAAQLGEGAGETTLCYTRYSDYGPIAEGRTAGVILVFTDCEDPAEEDDYNEWYAHHLEHTIDALDLYAATRYVASDPARAPSKYLSIYESQSSDAARVQKDGIDWWVQGGFEGPKSLVGCDIPATRID